MKFVFFGTPEFAAIILEKLIKAGFVPQAVVCNPDKPVGRKKIVTPPPVKARIMNYESGIKNRIKILQPEKLDPSLFIIHNSLFDFFVVASYAKIIPKEILDIPRFGTLGVHPSLLPKYRGPSPIQTALLNGDEKTGVTLYLMDEGLDSGPILAQRELSYELRIMNYEALMRNLADLSADLLVETLPTIDEKIKNAVPQNEPHATYTKKFTTKDAYIEPNNLEKAGKNGGDAAVQIERKIRALNPEPGVWTTVCENTKLYEITKAANKRVKLLEAELIDGKLRPMKIQVEGGNPQTIKS